MGQSDQLRLRQVDDYGFIMPSKGNRLHDLQKSFTVDNGILTLDKEVSSMRKDGISGSTSNENSPKRLLALPWNEVVKKHSRVENSGEGPSSRVSALDPSRLMIKDVPREKLSFKPTLLTDGEGTTDRQCVTISPPMNFLQSARKMCDSSLVAYFVSASLTFERTRAVLFKLWGNMGMQKVFYNSKGFYTLKFNMVSEMESVLKLGSIIIDKRKLLQRPWMEGTHFQKNQLISIPIWVKFVNVPHSYWSVDGLSYIASAIGVPISLDSPTSNLEPMKFARICVNLKYDSLRPKEIMVPVLSDEDGSMIMVRVQVEYPILPPNCSHCRCFGHSLSKCSAYRSHVEVLQETNTTIINESRGMTSTSRRVGKEPITTNNAITTLVNHLTGVSPKIISPKQINFTTINDLTLMRSDTPNMINFHTKQMEIANSVEQHDKIMGDTSVTRLEKTVENII